MTYDPVRGLNFAYNILDKPSAISSGTETASYKFLADGTKALVEDSAGGSGYAYMGSMIFAYGNGNWASDGSLQGEAEEFLGLTKKTIADIIEKGHEYTTYKSNSIARGHN